MDLLLESNKIIVYIWGALEMNTDLGAGLADRDGETITTNPETVYVPGKTAPPTLARVGLCRLQLQPGARCHVLPPPHELWQSRPELTSQTVNVLSIAR